MRFLQFRKPELVPLVFMTGAVVLLMSLGIWQVQRLQWKNHLIGQTETAQHQPTLNGLPKNIEGLEYRNVTLKGTFLYTKTMRRVGGIQGEGPGYFLITPMKLADGRVVLVNRGFSPSGKESKPGGVQTIHGIIRPFRGKPSSFAPANQPEKNVWFSEDVLAMQKFVGLPMATMMVEAVGKPQPHVYPIVSDGHIWFRNDHLQYAITWFSLAAIGVIMFGAYYRKPNEAKA